MKRKVLILQHEITGYNSPIYDIIAEHADLTVGYFLRDVSQGPVKYKKTKLDFFRISRFIFVKGLRRLRSQFDTVVFDPNPMCLSYYLVPLFKHGNKTIPWTIGVRASYKRRYVLPFKQEGLYYHVMDYEFRKSDAIVFYMEEPISCWLTDKLPREKFFVAHNTVRVNEAPIDWNLPRTSILFVGTLYKEKKVEELIRSYLNVAKKQPDLQMPTLDIVGNGDQMDYLNKLVAEEGQGLRIAFHGAIYDEEKLRGMFARALVCVSPDQAGLSVLKSMGYGVPFVTRTDAITGGERLNIKDGYNGFFYNQEHELEEIILKAARRPDLMLTMGRNARNFYESYATPKLMAQGILDAIEYAHRSKY